MTFANLNLIPAQAEIFMLAAVSVILIVDLFLRDEQRHISYWLTQLTLLGCALITVHNHTPEVVYTFNNMFVGDSMSDVLKVATYIAVSAMLVYSRSYIGLRGMFRGEFFTLTLFATLGMMMMISANHLLTLYLGLELQALSLYALVALRRDSARGTEAAMKYFVLGALASGMLLYGMSMIYGATGSLEIGVIANKIGSGSANSLLLTLGVVFIVSGLAFKLGAVPFHMWVPDVYEGAPTAVTMFVGSAPKLAAFAFLMRLLPIALGGLFKDWQMMLVILAVASIAIGNITAIAQTNIKRMMAYSTISHMGFLLLGIIAGSANGLASSMFYAIAYVMMTLGGFGVVMLLSSENDEADTLDSFKGLNQRSPWFAFVMLLLMVSMAGIPGTVGFFAKFSVLQAVVEANMYWLAIVAVMLSLVGAFYYLRIVKMMYFDEPAANVVAPAGGLDARVLLTVNGLLILGLGILPQSLMVLCVDSIKQTLHIL